MPAVLDPRVFWHCNECGQEHVTTMAAPHTPLHPCREMAGLMVPFVPKGSKAGMRRKEREDYAGTDILARDGNGNVVMAVVTEHDDGHTDCTVYAGTAQATGESLGT